MTAEVRWPAGSARLAYVGDGRWRRDSTTVAFLREHVDAIARTIMDAPGRVEFDAPGGVHDTIEVVRRDDLMGVLPPQLVPLDVTRPTHQPFVQFAMFWLGWHCERCWADDVARRADRVDERFSSDAFAASKDPKALAADLHEVLAARVRAAPHPEQTYETAIRELAALGHTTTFSDSDGDWSTWASQWIFVTFNPPSDCSVTVEPMERRSE
jgi:hypothetical protein